MKQQPMKTIITLPTYLTGITLLGITMTTEATDPLTINPESPWYGYDRPGGWAFDVGIGVEREPTYAGSDNYDAEPGLFARALYVTEKRHCYYISLGEAGATFALSPRTRLTAFLEYEEERDNGEDDALRGLDTIDSTIEGQVMLAQRFGNATVFGILQPDLAGNANKGVVWFVGTSYDQMINDRWRWSTRIDVSGANSEHMQTGFGITSAESQRTDYDEYKPGSGLKSVTWGLGSEYYITGRLSVIGGIETEYYFSEAADSPLIRREGSRTTTEASLSLRWQF